MKLFKSLINWCLEEKKAEPKKEDKFYVPCKNFYKYEELKSENTPATVIAK